MKCAFSLLLTAILVGLVASYSPTLSPAISFNDRNDAKTLHDAIDGFGTDETKIISVLTHRVGYQRAQIAHSYSDQFGKTLKDDLDGDLGGHFGKLCISLTYTTNNFLAIELHRILDKRVPDPLSVQEVLISRSETDLANIKIAYASKYQRTLKNDIESKFSGNAKQLVSLLSDGNRPDNNTPIDQVQVKRDADDLYNEGRGVAGTNEAVFVNIFTSRSYSHLSEVYSKYATTYRSTIESAIRSKIGSDMQDLLLDIVQRGNNKVKYFANRFHQAMDGPGTKDNSLSRLIISRCEIDLGDIKTEYQRLFGKSLRSAVKDETSGDFKRALLSLIG